MVVVKATVRECVDEGGYVSGESGGIAIGGGRARRRGRGRDGGVIVVVASQLEVGAVAHQAVQAALSSRCNSA